MIEVGASEASEQDVAAGFAKAVEEHNKILAWQKKIVGEIGKAKRSAEKPDLPAALTDLFQNEFAQKLHYAVFCGLAGKDAIHALMKEWLERINATEELKEVKKSTATHYFDDQVDVEIHRGAIENNKRADDLHCGDVR